MNERLYYLGVKAIIRNASNQILVLKHAKGYWDFPGGRIQQDEEPIQALLREVKEETGISQLDNIASQFMKLLPVNIADHGLILWYHNCNVKEVDVTLSDEHTNFLWLEESEAFTLTKFTY